MKFIKSDSVCNVTKDIHFK